MMALPVKLDDYSDKQLLCAQLLASMDENGLTKAQVANEVGIDPRTIYRWQVDPDFVALINHFAEINMNAFVPELYAHLRRAVRGGSTRAMELALKQQGKLIDRKELTGQIGIGVSAEDGLSSETLKAEIEELKRKIDKQQSRVTGEVIDAEIVGEDQHD